MSYKKSEPRLIVQNSMVENTETFSNTLKLNENAASYNLDIKMHPSGKFDVMAIIQVTNKSSESWKEILFYLIPNMYTEKNKPESIPGASELKIGKITVNGAETSYDLYKDTLKINLKSKLAPRNHAEVRVRYSFTLPEEGKRFAIRNGNFYLAEWYPMLVTYRSGWEKEEYNFFGESYHTDYSDFKVQLELPSEDYLVASTADTETYEQVKKKLFKTSRVKEFYIAIMKETFVKKKNINGTEIRLIGNKVDESFGDQYLETAIKGFSFFEKHLGDYPYKQLDIIMNGDGMEYPGIVTVGTGAINEHVVIHEVAHQWFYGLVSNNPYHTAFVDEGLTNFATYLYFILEGNNKPEEVFSDANASVQKAKETNTMQHSNLRLSEFDPNGYMAAVYETPALRLWELSKRPDKALEYLRTYFQTYKYSEVDTQEWVRFTKSYFNIDDDDPLKPWIEFGE
ncbi:M1 family metallopeptidase [Fictibacillus sp. BK138]|uniref:M1 family metallopeptidase n=1 Tax=Fictibacillus sp. BK138 TaxID=2512121 RepID=UPI0010CED7EF|nr:M1 family metallopeptidase [Fictibacillus sp. BK138]RZT15511.1 peptidase M1-like protein [Fictibacillus sp. BK138]